MNFYKFQGAGNDFIIINNIEEKLPPEKIPGIAKRICARKRSLGADGLLLVEAAQRGGDLAVRVFNADGSESEMCGNGMRCAARYALEEGPAGGPSGGRGGGRVVIETADLLTYERGVEDFTLACGTGADSTALSLKRRGLIHAREISTLIRGIFRRPLLLKFPFKPCGKPFQKTVNLLLRHDLKTFQNRGLNLIIGNIAVFVLAEYISQIYGID
jgi:hypothetical protein